MIFYRYNCIYKVFIYIIKPYIIFIIPNLFNLFVYTHIVYCLFIFKVSI